MQLKINGFIFFAIFLVTISSESFASEVQHIKTSNGIEYGFIQGEKSKPLVLIFTTDVNASISGAFTSVGNSLKKNGYSIAAVDVTCHGKDVHKGEVAGLDCWAARVRKSKSDIFNPMVEKASAAISDIWGKNLVSKNSVIAIGVSRGGYAAIRLARYDKRVNHLVLLAPVTDLRRLSEFSSISIDDSLYSLKQGFKALSEKNIFLQIGNSDDRVGTAEALSFVNGVVAARPHELVNITAVISPIRGHGTAQEDIAQAWVIDQFENQKVKLRQAP